MGTEYDRALADLNKELPAGGTAHGVADILRTDLEPRLPAAGTLSTLAVGDVPLAVPAADATTNTNERDVVGNKTDIPAVNIAATKSIMSYIKRIFSTQGFVQPILNDSFQTSAAAGDPSATYWSVIEDAGASVTCIYAVSTSYLRVYAGGTPTDDAVAHTKEKICFSPAKAGTTSLIFRTYAWCVDLTGEFGFGLFYQQFADFTANQWTSAQPHAGIKCNNDVVAATSGDGATEEVTDISAAFTQNAWVLIEIVMTTANTKFYVNSVLVATHAVHPSNGTSAIGLSSKNTNGIATDLYFQNVQVWAE